MTDVGRMKVAELRAGLSARGLSAQGLKADLTTRLAAALESEKASSAEKIAFSAGSGGGGFG